jgi:hypothetical protein
LGGKATSRLHRKSLSERGHLPCLRPLVRQTVFQLLKGIVPRDFWPSIFSIKLILLGPWFTGENLFAEKFILRSYLSSKIKKIFAALYPTMEKQIFSLLTI